MACENREVAGLRKPGKLVAEIGSLAKRLAEVQPLLVEQAELLNALICMTGWAKAYADEKGWTPENASLIWAGIRHADGVMDKAMGGPKPPGYFAPSNVEVSGPEGGLPPKGRARPQGYAAVATEKGQ